MAMPAPKAKSVLNPDAPEFSPSYTRTLGKLNADAPEFIPGQLGSFDGGIGYVSVPDVKHGKGYPRPVSPMYPPEGQYVPHWVPQQYVPMWIPYQPNVYGKNAMFDYAPYGYGGSRNFDGPDMRQRPPRGPKRNVPYPEGQKREADAAYAARTPPLSVHVPMTHPEIHPRDNHDGTSPDNIPTTVPPNPETTVKVDGTFPQADVKLQQLTWADRFRMSRSEPENNQTKTEEFKPPISMWNGRPSFADMMRKSAKSEENMAENNKSEAEAPLNEKCRTPVKTEEKPVVPTNEKIQPQETELVPDNVSATVEETVKQQEVVETAENTNIVETADDAREKDVAEETEEQSESVKDTPDAEEMSTESQQSTVKEEAVDNDMIYNIDQITACGILMRLHDLIEDPKLVFSLASVKDAKGGMNRRNNAAHYDDRNNSKQRGDHWTLQRRQSKPEGKSFSNGFRSSKMEFSRDQLEAVSLPRASESSWIIKQAKLKQDKEHQLMRRIMGLLNRLTVEKFDTIYKNILLSGIETVQQASMLVKIIFEKAIAQHHFIPMYVELCAKLSYDLHNFSDSQAPSGDQQQGEAAASEKKPEPKSAKKSDFMCILLNCCQDFFESNLKPLKFPPDLEGDDKFEFELKYKHRMRGNMVFVGELFKQKLLAAKLLITCLDQVFAKREECIASTGSIDTGDNHLEGVCTLLQTVGKSFDTDKWKYAGELEKRIQKLTDLGKNANICFRIRCLIQNVLDSRHENWAKSTPYKLEGPCRLQELRSKVMEQEKQQEENVWRNKRRGRMFDQKSTSSTPTTSAPNVIAAPASPEITSEDLKRRARGIVSELVLSHDVNEATLCITELNLPHHRDKELYELLFNSALEACAKLTAYRDRSLVAKWLVELAVSRSSHRMLISWLQGFINDEPVEHGYSMMVEDYPVVPRMLRELLNNMKDEYIKEPGFFEVASFIENETSNLPPTTS